MNVFFKDFRLVLIKLDDTDSLSVGRKLGCMANEGKANVGNKIFTELERRDFPDLFDSTLGGGTFSGFTAKGVVVRKGQLNFMFDFLSSGIYTVEIPLKDSSGSFTMFKDGAKYMEVGWRNGAVYKYDKFFGDEVTSLPIEEK